MPTLTGNALRVTPTATHSAAETHATTVRYPIAAGGAERTGTAAARSRRTCPRLAAAYPVAPGAGAITHSPASTTASPRIRTTPVMTTFPPPTADHASGPPPAAAHPHPADNPPPQGVSPASQPASGDTL